MTNKSPFTSGRRRVLVLAPHFRPGYKAGGALRSLVGIIDSAPDQYDMMVVTSDRDLGDDEPYAGLSGAVMQSGRTSVHYVDVGNLRHWWRAVHDARAFGPELVYLNSLWNPHFGLLPALLVSARMLGPSRVLVAPRGQLAPTALRLGRRVRKRLLILWWRRWLRHPGRHLHCTNKHEARQAVMALGAQGHIVLSEDPVVDRRPARRPWAPHEEGPLRAVCVSRVARVKNVHSLVSGLARAEREIQLTVVGPLEDTSYLMELQAACAQLPQHVSVVFTGPLPHDKVQEVLSSSDLFCFPTLGENFGHVVPEAWAASCPVAAGPVTPFTQWLEEGGGEQVDHLDPQAWAELLDRWSRLGSDQLTDRHLAASRCYRAWTDSREETHVFDHIPVAWNSSTDSTENVLPPTVARDDIDFLTYSSRSGSTFLAREIDRRVDILVVPETQCLYHALTMSPTSEISPGQARRMVERDRQIYWFNDEDLARLSAGSGLTPAEFTHVVGATFACHQNVPAGGRMVFKLGGALHIWPHIIKVLPHARAVDITRDGRAVVNSSLRAEAPYLSGASLSFDDPVRAAKTWSKDWNLAQRWIESSNSVVQVRFRDLVTDPAGTVDSLATRLGWPPGSREAFQVNSSEEAIHRLVDGPARRARIDTWRSELSRRDRIIVESISRRELEQWGADDFIAPGAIEKITVLGSAFVRHLINEARFAVRRLSRVDSREQLTHKIAYRLKRARSS